MDNDEVDLIEARRRLSEIDAKMRAALGSDITLRGKLYRKRISLEKKFMKQIAPLLSLSVLHLFFFRHPRLPAG